MSIVNIVVTTSKVITAGYRIITTSILIIYLIRDAMHKEKYGRESFRDGGGLSRGRTKKRNQKTGGPAP